MEGLWEDKIYGSFILIYSVYGYDIRQVFSNGISNEEAMLRSNGG